MSDSVRPHRRQPTRLPVPGILQARTLEWVAISFSNAWKWKVKVKSLSRVRLLAIPWTAAFQAPPPMGFYNWNTIQATCVLVTTYSNSKQVKLPVLTVYFIYSIISKISFQCVISISKCILPQYSNLIKNSVAQLQLHFKCSVATWLVVILSQDNTGPNEWFQKLFSSWIPFLKNCIDS